MHPELINLVKASYFDTYLKTLDSSDPTECLELSKRKFLEVVSEIPEHRLDHRYEQNKWSIKELIMHLLDTEMIFNYRALRIGREEAAQNLEGFDENAYANQARVDGLSKAELLHFFSTLRDSTILLYKSFSEDQLKKVGIASKHEVEVRALFLINAGHTLHHLHVIKERYLN